ncbi:glycosyltransferase family 4 protein [Mucilaginibacter flavus]|uniref:glycosyltransferase family 4 protein n=1 Tax=Mucilaginibacter flavus TaxID=931504 RepID=UPI0025B45474|nr:glycosyltransferase family 4 protein [Mucilaginibacter flavus]MDN3582817.1 glycosyltransferase family 4 protein [Mucilaginibacter flavus]
MSLKHVLYVFGSSNYSGAEIVITRLIENNKLVVPIVLCPPGPFSELLTGKGIKVINERSLKALNRANKERGRLATLLIVALNFLKINSRVLGLIWKHKLKIIHANNLSASVYILPVVVFFKLFSSSRKFVWSNHDLVYPDGKKMDDLAGKCVKNFDATLAVSLAVKNKFATDLQEKIHVLYNGLDLELFKSSPSLRANFREEIKAGEEIIIAIVGLIIPRKGHLLLINVINELAQTHGNIKLLIVGKFLPVEHEYELLVKELVDSKHIFLQGYSDNVIELYSGIDILVNASLPEMSEPLGTTIYEAMALNKIVVASNTGGSPEIVTHKINGFLFEAGDSQSLKNVLTEVLDNWDNLNEVRQNARKLTEQKFNIDKMVKNYNSILQID